MKRRNKNSNNIQLFLPNSVICYRNQTHFPLCFKDHISLTWASCMPKVISDLQRVRAAHRRDFWFKKGGIWKPIAQPDVNSLSRGSRCDAVRVLPPFHHADAPRTVSQRRWLQKRTWQTHHRPTLPRGFCRFPGKNYRSPALVSGLSVNTQILT